MPFVVMQWFSFLLSGLELEHSKLPTKQPKLQNIAYPFKWKRESWFSSFLVRMQLTLKIVSSFFIRNELF